MLFTGCSLQNKQVGRGHSCSPVAPDVAQAGGPALCPQESCSLTPRSGITSPQRTC